MLYHFLYPLKSYWSILNLFQYITFRSALAAIIALLISFIFGPKVIHMLKFHHIDEKMHYSFVTSFWDYVFGTLSDKYVMEMSSEKSGMS